VDRASQWLPRGTPERVARVGRIGPDQDGQPARILGVAEEPGRSPSSRRGEEVRPGSRPRP
jgi:hypothetical protein